MNARTMRSLGIALGIGIVGCSSTPDDSYEPTTIAESELTVAGSTLTAAQAKWVLEVEKVVARLPGTQAERARRAAIVVWWALKEGVLDVQPSPYRHNLCTSTAGGVWKDVKLGDLDQCWGPAWQVGLSGIQVPNVTDWQVTNMASTIYPGVPLTTLLAQIATAAGIDPSSPTGKGIVASTGRLRSSWLLRDPAIGIALQWPFADDCYFGGPSWCYGSWAEAKRFASGLWRIQQVIADLEKRYLAAAASPPSAPAPSPAPESDPCNGATLGDGAYCATFFDTKADPNILYQCKGLATATKTICENGCKRMPDGSPDVCASAPPSSERAAMMDRAEQWVKAKMPYCGATPGNWDGICGKYCTERQTASLLKPEWNKYRSDCSGFVSWVWQLSFQDGHRTWGFAPFNQEGPAFSEKIPASKLQPGDALNSVTTDIYQQHIILFGGWVDQANGIARTLEEANCSADLVDTPNRKLVVNSDGSVTVGSKAYWPIRKIGVP